METYVEVKGFVHNSHFLEQRQNAINGLSLEAIDEPIVEIIAEFAKLPYCFTLQSCYGHFLHGDQTNTKNLEPLPNQYKNTSVEYRIAYIALCIQNNDHGKGLLKDLSELQAIDPKYIQYGCADWFWERQKNSYVVQVEPERHKTKDRCVIEFQEALYIEKVRNEFFEKLRKKLNKSI